MLCKYCKKNNGAKYSKYTSGEFCSKACSKGYSTSLKRSEINSKVSRTLIDKFKTGPKLSPGKVRVEKDGKALYFFEKICPECQKTFLNRKREAIYCSRKCVWASDDYKMKVSKNRIEYLQSNKNVKWYSIQNLLDETIKVQGKWELEMANRLNLLCILFTRKSVKFANSHLYTPDFYLPEYDLFIEVKGFIYEKDKYKMLRVVEEKQINLKYIDNLKQIECIEKDELLNLPKIQDLFKKSDIDFSKFVLRY